MIAGYAKTEDLQGLPPVLDLCTPCGQPLDHPTTAPAAHPWRRCSVRRQSKRHEQRELDATLAAT
jgi:hypothetical protein